METTDPAGSATPARDAAAVEPREEKPQPKRSRRWMLELLVLVGSYFAITAYQERNLLPSREQAPAFSLRSLDGGTVSLDSLGGKRVVLHFWATWCGVCRQELGMLNAVQKSLTHDEVLLTIVADSDDPERIRQFVADEHLRYPVLLGDEDTLHAFKIGSFPTNYFLDKAGRITGHTVGMATRFGVQARLWAAGAL